MSGIPIRPTPYRCDRYGHVFRMSSPKDKPVCVCCNRIWEGKRCNSCGRPIVSPQKRCYSLMCTKGASDMGDGKSFANLANI